MSGNASFAHSSSSTSKKLQEWSSLIGIVTAIVGNVLISFALNLQRYAHIRLGREQEEENEQWDGGQKSKHRNYGTQQNDVAEGRARLNLTAPTQEDSLPKGLDGKNGDGLDQSDGLPLHGNSLHSRSSSDSTIRRSSEKPHPHVERKTYLRSPYWWGGIVLMTVGEAGNFLAYGFAPASIVSPLGVVALVCNCLIAPLLLKERFRQRDFWGVAVAIAGAVVIVLSAKNSETKMGPDDVWGAITRWEFELYLGITVALIILLMWASGKYGERTVLIDLGLVGLFGGYTALSTKGVASLLSDTLWRALTFPITYLLIFILVVTAVMQIRYVNRALQRFDSTQVIPIQFVLFTISVILGSAILYRDFESATGDRIGKFIGGCILTFTGVYLITSGRARHESDGNEDLLDDEENAIGMVDEEAYQDEIADTEESQKSRHPSMSIKFDSNTDPWQSSQRSSNHRSTSGSISPQTPTNLKQSRTHSTASSTTHPSALLEPDTPLSANPWRSTSDISTPVATSRPRPPPESSISSPLLPSEAQRSEPSTPHNGQPPSPVPWTPGTNAQQRPSARSRQSIARLAPGPLMSPLFSSSLSAVVADEIRRGVESPATRKRPRLSGLRKSRSKSQRATLGAESSEDVPTDSSPLKGLQVPEEAVVEEGGEGGRPDMGRSKSVSARFGEFLKGKRKSSGGKGKGRGGEGDGGGGGA